MRPSDLQAWAKEELIRLVEIYSPSGEEGEILDYLKERLHDLELPWTTVPTPGGHDNLVVGATAPTLILAAHLDTVVPAWPWSGRAEVRDGSVFGLGAADDKAGVVAALLALLLAGAEERDIPPRVAVVLTVDEERNGTGSLAVADALRPPFALVLEGTGLSPGVALAGLVAANLEVRGHSVHGAFPEFGDNAIVKGARVVLDLEEAHFTGIRHPLLGTTRACVEYFAAGSDLYVVPDRARLRLDVKVVPGVTAVEVVEQLDVICRRHGGSLEVEEAVDAVEAGADSPLRAALDAALLRVTGARRPPVGVPAWTDAHNFVAVGADTIVFGPGRLIGSAHQPDEGIALDAVATAARVIADVIAHWDEAPVARASSDGEPEYD